MQMPMLAEGKPKPFFFFVSQNKSGKQMKSRILEHIMIKNRLHSC